MRMLEAKADNSSVFISLGSNTPDALSKLHDARRELINLAGWDFLAGSSIYLTEPQLYKNQAWFHNQVLQFTSGIWQPHMLMRKLLEMETRLGRQRDGERYGPRCIDMDILLFGNQVSNDPFCILPHPRLTERAFALVPLQELAPTLTIQDIPVWQWLDGLAWRREGNRIYQN